MSRIDWCEITGCPSDEEREILEAALEQLLLEETMYAPSSPWFRGELPGLPADAPGRVSPSWRKPAAKKVAMAIGGFGGVAASVALAIKMRHHRPPGDIRHKLSPKPPNK